MAGSLIEFPRKLEWTKVECFYGKVGGLGLFAKVETSVEGGGANWAVWNGPTLVAAGNVPGDIDEAKEAARKALESNVVVLRPVEGGSRG